MIAKSFADRGIEPTSLRETVYATCLAADAEGFTAMAEGMMPDAAACLAAAEALDAVRAFNERHAPLHLGVRLGLHTGRVFVGNAGVDGHFIYGIVGDIANTASRVEQLNERLGTRLLATEEVVSGLDDILVRPLGDFLLAGKRSSVSVVEILSAVESDGATIAARALPVGDRGVSGRAVGGSRVPFPGYPARLSR